MAFIGHGKRNLLRTHTYLPTGALTLLPPVCACVYMSVCVCARRHCERERNKRERELEEMGVLQSRMRMDISVVRGSRACTMRVPGSASAVHAPGLLPAPARGRDQCRAQDAHGAGRARPAPHKSGSPADTRRLRGLCLGASRRRSRATAPWCSAYTPLEQSVPRASPSLWCKN